MEEENRQLSNLLQCFANGRFLFKVVDEQVKVFKWTGKNQYFALCESGFVSFGGG